MLCFSHVNAIFQSIFYKFLTVGYSIQTCWLLQFLLKPLTFKKGSISFESSDFDGVPRSLYVSVKLPTYPSPKPTLTLNSSLGQNADLGEG